MVVNLSSFWENAESISIKQDEEEKLEQILTNCGVSPIIICLEGGSYLISKTIRIPSKVWLQGRGAEKTTLIMKPGLGKHAITNADPKTGNSEIRISDLQIQGNRETQKKLDNGKDLAFCCAMIFENCQSILLENLKTVNIRQTGAHFINCLGINIVHLTCEKLGWSGLSTSNSFDLTARSVDIRLAGLDSRHSGVHFDGGGKIKLEASISHTTGNGLMIDTKWAPFRDAEIQAYCSDCKRGVAIIGDSESDLQDVRIQGRFDNNQEAGVFLSNCQNIKISNSVIQGNKLAGVVLQGNFPMKSIQVVNSEFDNNVDILQQNKQAELVLTNVKFPGILSTAFRKTSRGLETGVLKVKDMLRVGNGQTQARELAKNIENIRKSGLFNEKWYMQKYPDVVTAGLDPISHYLKYGAEEFRNPSDQFNTREYMESHPELQETKENALIHFIDHSQQQKAP